MPGASPPAIWVCFAGAPCDQRAIQGHPGTVGVEVVGRATVVAVAASGALVVLSSGATTVDAVADVGGASDSGSDVVVSDSAGTVLDDSGTTVVVAFFPGRSVVMGTVVGVMVGTVTTAGFDVGSGTGSGRTIE